MSWMAACPRSSSSPSRFRTAANLTAQSPQAVASSATGASHIGQGTVDTAPFVSGSSTWSARRRLCRARSASPRRACSFVFRTQSPGYAGSSSASRSRDWSAARGSSRVAWAAAIANRASESFGFILSRSLAICMMRESRRARSSWDSRTAPSAGPTEEAGEGAPQGHAEIRAIDGGADHDAFLFDVEDRFFAPGVPVHDPQAILGRDRVQVHAESAKVRDDRVGRLARDDHESAAPRLQAFRQEGEGEAELLLARRALEDDARSDGQAALDHGVETLNARGQPRHAITIPKAG